jgi:single-stranded-DNA-specific exonuclease
VLLVAGQGWHQGVVGIVAARLSEKYARPSIVIGLEGDEGRGSARSVEGFSVLEAMHGGAEHMLRYGGHAAAAGCEVRADSIESLRDSVCTRARELLDGDDFPPPEILIDADVPFAEMNENTMREIDKLEPFGAGNEPLVLLSRDVRVGEPPRRLGADRSHLALQLRSGSNLLKAMAFGRGERADELALGTALEIVYRPRWNTFRGRTNLELQLLDFRVAGS